MKQFTGESGAAGCGRMEASWGASEMLGEWPADLVGWPTKREQRERGIPGHLLVGSAAAAPYITCRVAADALSRPEGGDRKLNGS